MNVRTRISALLDGCLMIDKFIYSYIHFLRLILPLAGSLVHSLLPSSDAPWSAADRWRMIPASCNRWAAILGPPTNRINPRSHGRTTIDDLPRVSLDFCNQFWYDLAFSNHLAALPLLLVLRPFRASFGRAL
jgi:hypothetical protein